MRLTFSKRLYSARYDLVTSLSLKHRHQFFYGPEIGPVTFLHGVSAKASGQNVLPVPEGPMSIML